MTTGFRAQHCRCGHPVGDHQSSGNSFPHPPRYGVCHARDCDCREFVEDDGPEASTTARSAA